MDIGNTFGLDRMAAENALQDGLIKRAQGPQPSANPDDLKARSQVRKAAEDFEAIFFDIVMKSMRESVQKSGFIDGGNAEDIYRSMLDSEYSKMLAAQGNTGLSVSIENQLLAAMGKTPVSPSQALNGYRKSGQHLGAETLRDGVKQATITKAPPLAAKP